MGERGVVVSNKALEEFLERLLRWDELCAQLRELYYRYLDLAAFRSDKCFFPGRRCVRSWNRKYDAGDLTLMWTYILNTAPLCGKLVKALAEVEYKIRKRALENLEKYGGTENRLNLGNECCNIVQIYLKTPVHVYLVLWNKSLYVIWGEFNDLPKKGYTRSVEIERKVLDIVEQYRRGKRVKVGVEEYEVDREYERLWLEIPLPESVAKLLGGRGKAPVALFRNLGWLLSDDSRFRLEHASSNPGQVAMRVFDWIAVAMYAKKASQTDPLVFRLSVYQIIRTKDGDNSLIEMWPIGTAAEIIQTVYERFGIALSGTERVIARGYAVLNALREEAFKREGLTYVVDDVGAWLAFSATTTMLVLGDGYVTPTVLGVVTKSSPEKTLKGEMMGVRELAKALGGVVAGKEARLQSWHMRLLLPAPPVPSFEKAVKLYDALVNYPAAAAIEINGTTYLLAHNGDGKFIIGKEKSAELYEAVKRLGVRIRVRKDELILTYAQLRALAKLVPVRLLSELDRDAIREVRPAPSLDPEAVRRVLEEVAKMARLTLARNGKYVHVRVIPYDKSKLQEIATMLKAVGMRFSIDQTKGRIMIYERSTVEMIRKIMPHFFTQFSVDYSFYQRVTPAFPLPFTFLLSKRRRRREKRKTVCPTRRPPSALHRKARRLNLFRP